MFVSLDVSFACLVRHPRCDCSNYRPSRLNMLYTELLTHDRNESHLAAAARAPLPRYPTTTWRVYIVHANKLTSLSWFVAKAMPSQLRGSSAFLPTDQSTNLVDKNLKRTFNYLVYQVDRRVFSSNFVTVVYEIGLILVEIGGGYIVPVTGNIFFLFYFRNFNESLHVRVWA